MDSVLFLTLADVCHLFGHHILLLGKQMKDSMFTVLLSKLPFCYLLFYFYLSLSSLSHSDMALLLLVNFYLVFYYHSKH
ncbi:hypothetical protein RLOC_00014009 [Lonchura striata]|uniref:Uncharacterized protein n=1 Tax=Lonchura striata TaxID=40157 RepID=A0A218VC62_9PASE|nr:hypothetical protein RLOC_00014009 [Lonchura striata domestica]